MDTLTVYKEQLKSDIHWMSVFRKAIEQGKAQASSPWTGTPEQKELLSELDAMLGHACQILPTLRRSWDATWAMLTSGIVDDYNELREELQHSFDAGIALITDVHALLKSFVASRYPLRGLDRMAPIIQELRDFHEGIFVHWPVLTQTDIKEARTSSDNLPLDEAFAQIANVAPTVWQLRVAELSRARGA